MKKERSADYTDYADFGLGWVLPWSGAAVRYGAVSL